MRSYIYPGNHAHFVTFVIDFNGKSNVGAIIVVLIYLET